MTDEAWLDAVNELLTFNGFGVAKDEEAARWRRWVPSMAARLIVNGRGFLGKKARLSFPKGFTDMSARGLV